MRLTVPVTAFEISCIYLLLRDWCVESCAVGRLLKSYKGAHQAIIDEGVQLCVRWCAVKSAEWVCEGGMEVAHVNRAVTVSLHIFVCFLLLSKFNLAPCSSQQLPMSRHRRFINPDSSHHMLSDLEVMNLIVRISTSFMQTRTSTTSKYACAVNFSCTFLPQW